MCLEQMEVYVPEGYPATQLSEFLTRTAGSVVMDMLLTDPEYANHLLAFLETKKDWDTKQFTTRFEFYLTNAGVLRRVHRPDGSFQTAFSRVQHRVDQCVVSVKKHAFVQELRLAPDAHVDDDPGVDKSAPIVDVDRVVQSDESSFVYRGWKYSLVKTFEGKTLTEVQENSLRADHARHSLRIVPVETTTCHSSLYRAVDYLLKAESVLNTKVRFEIAAA